MELLVGLVSKRDGLHRTHLLRLNKFLCGLKQGSYNWFMNLKNGLEARDLTQSNMDPGVFFGDCLVSLTHVDDVIIIGDTNKKIEQLFRALHDSNKNFDFTDKGSIDKYLGMEIKQLGKYYFVFSQSLSIKHVLALHGIKQGTANEKLTPVGKPLLNTDLSGEPHKHKWNYRG